VPLAGQSLDFLREAAQRFLLGIVTTCSPLLGIRHALQT
jgi:hypothetical protein